MKSNHISKEELFYFVTKTRLKKERRAVIEMHMFNCDNCKNQKIEIKEELEKIKDDTNGQLPKDWEKILAKRIFNGHGHSIISTPENHLSLQKYLWEQKGITCKDYNGESIYGISIDEFNMFEHALDEYFSFNYSFVHTLRAIDEIIDEYFSHLWQSQYEMAIDNRKIKMTVWTHPKKDNLGHAVVVSRTADDRENYDGCVVSVEYMDNEKQLEERKKLTRVLNLITEHKN